MKGISCPKRNCAFRCWHNRVINPGTIGKTTPNSSEGRHRSYGTHDNGRSVLLYEVYADPALNENNVKRLFREWGLEIVNGKTRKRGEGFAMSSEQFQIVKDPGRLRAAIASAR